MEAPYFNILKNEVSGFVIMQYHLQKESRLSLN